MLRINLPIKSRRRIEYHVPAIPCFSIYYSPLCVDSPSMPFGRHIWALSDLYFWFIEEVQGARQVVRLSLTWMQIEICLTLA